jgi:hypothetical protein
LSLWGIPYDRTKEDLIEVYLCDLRMLPTKEQNRWKAFNVLPRGSISEHRWKRDYEAQFANPVGDAVFDFHHARRQAQDAFRATSGGLLFLDLHDEDKYIETSVRLPISESSGELDRIVLAMAKLTVDSLNKGQIEQLLPADAFNQQDGSLTLLAKILEQKGLSTEEATEAVRPLRRIQAIRSSGAAHRRGANYDQTMAREGFENQSSRYIIEELLRGATKGLTSIASAFGSS